MVVYLFYYIFFSKDQLFIRNRFFIMGGILVSFLLPLISIPIIIIKEVSQIQSFAYILDNSTSPTPISAKASNLFLLWPKWIMWAYGVGSAFFLLKTIIAYSRVGLLIHTSTHNKGNQLHFAITSKKVSVFSFFRWMIVSEETLQHPSFEKMVQHEMIHSRQYHSVDLFIGELLILFQWFNPFAWVLRKAMVENLEYLVDREVLTTGVNAKEYQYLLLNFSMAGLTLAVANNFNINLLKKRIIMMNTNPSTKRQRIHNYLIPICLTVLLATTVSFKKETKTVNVPGSITRENVSTPFVTQAVKQGVTLTSPTDNKVVSTKVSENNTSTPPISASNNPNGEEAFLKYIMSNIKYPKEAAVDYIKVKLNFLVSFEKNKVVIIDPASSKVSNPKALKEVVVIAYGSEGIKIQQTGFNHLQSAGPFKLELMRVLNSYTDIPADLVGKTFLLPLNFSLMPPKDSKSEISVTGYGSGQDKKINSQVTIIEEADGKSSNEEPFYILNNEKFISKEEMQKINPETMQSIEVLKAKKMEHKTLGTINGSVIIINLKK